VKEPKFLIFYFLFLISYLCGCKPIDVFEKNAPIPKNLWDYSFQPSFEFNIADTSAAYNLYVVLRHTDAYKYNNIWLNIGTQSPADSMRFQRLDLLLGTDAKGWEGTGMDDIWELRKLITNGPYQFRKPGRYKFMVGQIMRENPLANILSVGIRVEKVK
jgi:gliding motility-associated lipoprotein GldH